jgi:hypothetical protein
MKNGVFRDVTPYGILRTDVSEERIASIISMRKVPPKHRFLQVPHGVTSQKTTFILVTAVNT